MLVPGKTIASLLGFVLKSKYLVLTGFLCKTAIALFLVWHFNFADQHNLAEDYNKIIGVLESARKNAILENSNYILYSGKGNKLFLLKDMNENGKTDPGEQSLGPFELKCTLVPENAKTDTIKVVFHPDGMTSGGNIRIISGKTRNSKQVSIFPAGMLSSN